MGFDVILTINYTLRNDLTLMNEGIFEFLFIDIQFGNDKITCGTIYCAPKQDRFSNNQFKVQLKNALSTLNVSKNKGYIIGDLNYDLLQDSHTFTDDFVDIMYDHSFYPIINTVNQQELLKVQVHALIIFGLTFTIKI